MVTTSQLTVLICLYCFFTRRCYAPAGYAVALCLFVSLSVCHKPVLYQIAKHRITPTTPHSKPRNSSFLLPEVLVKVVWGHFQWGRHIQVGRIKWAIFDQFLTISQKWCRVET